MAVQCPRKYDA